MGAAPELPAGTVTFLFTDIEGSTSLLKRLGDGYAAVLDDHRGLLRDAFAAHGGREIDTQGDSFFYAFARAKHAIAAAIDSQRALAAHEWPESVELRVRMGMHSGEPLVGDERYVGIGVNRAARIGAAAHGGQVLLSDATRALVEDDLPEGVTLRDLGRVRLKDIDRPELISQLVAEGLQAQFPPLQTPRTGRLHSRRSRLGVAALVLGVAAAAVAAALLATGSGRSAVTLAANSLAVFDARTGHAVGDVPLGFAPSGVAVGGDSVWVLNGGGRTVTEIDPQSLKIRRTVGLDGPPGGQWASGSADWIALSRAVEMVGSEPTGTTTALPAWPQTFAGQCGTYITGSGVTIWVSTARKLAQLDSGGTVRRTLTLPALSGLSRVTCYGVQYTGGTLMAVRDPDESVGRLDPVSGAYTPILSGLTGLSASSQDGAWTAGSGSIWISARDEDPSSLRQRGIVTRAALASGQVVSKLVIGKGGGGLVVDPGTGVWVLDPAGETLVRVHPGGQSILRVPLGHFPCCATGGVAAGHGRIWVTLQSP